MLEVPKTWKEVFIQSKVCLALLLENIPLICSELPHEYETVIQAKRHVDSLFALKLFKHRFNLKQDYKA